MIDPINTVGIKVACVGNHDFVKLTYLSKNQVFSGF